LRAGGDDHLARVDGDAVRVADPLGDRLAQRGRALDVRVLRGARVERLLRGLLDERRRVEVRLARAEADDVDAGGLELRGLGGDGEGRGRFDDGQPAGELHGATPCLRLAASALTTAGGTIRETSPPMSATSLTSEEDT